MEWHKRITPYQYRQRENYVCNELDYLRQWAAGCAENAPTAIHKRSVLSTVYPVVMWVKDGKPYYKLWPAIGQGLSKIKLAIPVSSIYPLVEKMPDTVSVRFPIGHEMPTRNGSLREFLVSKLQASEMPDHAKICLAVSVDSGQSTFVRNIPVACPVGDTFALDSTKSVEEAIRCTALNATLSEQLQDAIRVYIGIAMIHDNPDMVEAVVLRKDQAKYAATRDPKYVEKAKRRGEYGFNVGANIEVLPHFRRPHFAIRWTGKGGEVPKLVPVQGCVVKRSKITDVPTGYQADEELAVP